MTRAYTHPPDGGYGWVVLFACHVNLFIAGGIETSIGMFLPKFLEDFDGASNSVVTFITSLTIGLVLGLGPLSSQLMMRFGCRTVVVIGGVIAMCGFLITSVAQSILVLTFGTGLLCGFGLGLVFVPSLAIIGCYFTTNYVKANAIANAGIGAGSMCFPLYFDFLIDKYGWRGAALVTSATCMQICVCGALIRPIRLKKDNTLDNTSDYQRLEDDTDAGNIQIIATDQTVVAYTESSELFAANQLNTLRQYSKDIFNKYFGVHGNFFATTPSFYLLGLACACYMVSFYYFWLFLPKIVVDLGMDSLQAATILSVSGIASTTMRALHFLIITKVGAPPLLIFMTSLIIHGLPMMAFPLLTSYLVLLVAAVFIGIGIGMAIPLLNVVAKEMVTTPQRHVLAIGWLYLFQGASNIVGGYLGGLLGELSGNYALAVMAGGFLNVVSVLLSIQLYRKIRENRTSE